MCPNGTIYNGENHCYYNSSNSNIGELFDMLATTISKLAHRLDHGQILGNFDQAIQVYDKDSDEPIDSIVVDVEFNYDSEEVDTSKFRYKFVIDDSKINCNINECYYESTLFSDLKLDLYDRDNNLLNTISLTSPIINIGAEKIQYIN